MKLVSRTFTSVAIVIVILAMVDYFRPYKEPCEQYGMQSHKTIAVFKDRVTFMCGETKCKKQKCK